MKVTKKECYSFKIVEGKPNVTDKKLGGVPYLPKGYEYPTDENDNPLALLFQINFEDIKLENYPEKGIQCTNLSVQIKWHVAVIPEYGAEYNLTHNAAHVFIAAAD